MLEAWLDWHRQTLLMKCAGLSAEQLKQRSAAPSTLTLHGLVRHMAAVERDWFRICLLLDVGGGSGAHALGAVLRWPHLQAVVFDIPPVCEVAEEVIACHGLQQRVSTQAGDMWEDAFPAADLHFYSQMYHGWALQKCQFLTQKSFASLQKSEVEYAWLHIVCMSSEGAEVE